MTIFNVKNNGTDGLPSEVTLHIDQDEDEVPFVNLTLEEPESGITLVDFVIEDEESVDDLLREVTEAVQDFKKRKQAEAKS